MLMWVPKVIDTFVDGNCGVLMGFLLIGVLTLARYQEAGCRLMDWEKYK